MFEFPAIFAFLQLRILFPENFLELFFVKPGKRPRTVFQIENENQNGFNCPKFRGEKLSESQVKDEEAI